MNGHHFSAAAHGNVIPISHARLLRAGRHVDLVPGEPLSRVDMGNLSTVVSLIAGRSVTRSAWVQGVWHALRQATGVPAPQVFQVRHLPTIVAELRRCAEAAAALRQAARAAEVKVLRQVVRERATGPGVLGEALAEIQAAADDSGKAVSAAISLWVEADLLGLAGREARPFGYRWDGDEPVFPVAAKGPVLGELQ